MITKLLYLLCQGETFSKVLCASQCKPPDRPICILNACDKFHACVAVKQPRREVYPIQMLRWHCGNCRKRRQRSSSVSQSSSRTRTPTSDGWSTLSSRMSAPLLMRYSLPFAVVCGIATDQPCSCNMHVPKMCALSILPMHSHGTITDMPAHFCPS